MANCTNPSCRKTLDDTFAFCPFCGADNRRPSERRKVRCTKHRSVPDGRACADCGARLDEDGEEVKGFLYRSLGLLMIPAGLGLAGFGVYCLLTPNFTGPGNRITDFALIGAGGALIVSGWYVLRGKRSDITLFDEID